MQKFRTILLNATMAVACTSLSDGPALTEADAGEALRAVRLMPLEPRRMAYRLNVDDREKRVDATLRPHQSRENCWWLRVGSHRHSLLRKTEGGGIDVLRQVLPDEGMTLDYDPALPLLPDRCEPGASARTKGGVRIETDDGEAHEGYIVHTVKLLGRVQTATPQGQTEALRVKTVDEVDLGLVDYRIEADTHYVPGLGRAHQRMKTTRRTLKLFSETTEERFRVQRWRAGEEQ